MYRIIGTDGKIYGPVGAEKIREWIAQSRADSRTPVFVDGAADWTFLGLLPEFAPAPASVPPVFSPARFGAVPARRNNGFATASLVCGLLAWTCCCCCLPFSLFGLIFGIIALAQINVQPEPQEGRTLAVAGLVLSVTHLLFSLGFGLVQLAMQPPHFHGHFGPI